MRMTMDFNGAVPTYTPLSYEIKQLRYSHEMATVKFRVAPGTRLPWSVWTPAHIRWTNNSESLIGEFWGYIWTASTAHDATVPYETATVVCIGASAPMKTQTPRSFGQGTASYAIREVVRGYSLQLRQDPTNAVLSTVAQGKESDWSFIARMSKQSGLVSYARGPSVLSLNPTRVLRDPAVYTRTFEMGILGGIQYDVLSFRPREDELGVPDQPGKVSRTAMGVDRQSGRLITASNTADPTISAAMQSESVSSVADAFRLVTSGSTLATHWVTANASLVGSPDVQAATTINLAGKGIGNDYTGLWLVLEATHYASFNLNNSRWNYTTEVTLGRDSPFNASYIINQNTTHPKPAQAILVANRWVNSGGIR